MSSFPRLLMQTQREKGVDALKEILIRAKQIRGSDRSKGSWRRAVQAAAREYDQSHPNPNRKPRRPSVASRVKHDPKMDALYRGFKKSLHALKLKYHNAGLTFLRVKQQERNPATSSHHVRKRLPPILLGGGGARLPPPPPTPRARLPLPPPRDEFELFMDEEEEEDPLLPARVRSKRIREY